MNRALKLLRVCWGTAVCIGLFAGSALADAPPVVVSAQPMGMAVLVKVKNAGSQPHGATVAVQASILGIPVTSSAHVNLAAGQTANVTVPFLGLVQGVITVGLSTDDSNPM